jgi:hypothetical protein
LAGIATCSVVAEAKRKNKQLTAIEMAGEPGEAMAHKAFDTILVLDFG